MFLLQKLFPTADVRTARNSIKMFGIICVVFVSLITNPFTLIVNRYLYIAIMLCFAAACFLCHRFLAETEDHKLTLSLKGLFVLDRRKPKKYFWLLVLAATAMGYLKGSWGLGNLIDLIIMGIGILMIFDAPDSLDGYKIVLKLITGFALFYAASIWVQVLLPGVYDRFVALTAYGGNEFKILENYYTGFTSNPQCTAAYIAGGIFACLTELPHKRPATIFALVFFFISLLYTGVRMQIVLICVLIVLALYVITPRKKWLKLTVVLCVVGILVWLATAFFPEQMSRIPIFKRLYITAEDMQSGEDFSSGRSALYQHALNLFKENPVFGIGWGNFRETVPGTITVQKELDVHCIYLQVLCEIGVVGFLCYCPALLYTLFKTLQAYCKNLKNDKTRIEMKIMGFSALYQIFFFAFGLADNTLYVPFCLIPYLISCGMLFAYLNSASDTNPKKISNDKE